MFIYRRGNKLMCVVIKICPTGCEVSRAKNVRPIGLSLCVPTHITCCKRPWNTVHSLGIVWLYSLWFMLWLQQWFPTCAPKNYQWPARWTVSFCRWNPVMNAFSRSFYTYTNNVILRRNSGIGKTLVAIANDWRTFTCCMNANYIDHSLFFQCIVVVL
jgi:hypothetical protein